jgi:hypothetical protein
MKTIELNNVELVFLEVFLKEMVGELKKQKDPAFRDTLKSILKKVLNAQKT